MMSGMRLEMQNSPSEVSVKLSVKVSVNGSEKFTKIVGDYP
jgi:hypothetical protein